MKVLTIVQMKLNMLSNLIHTWITGEHLLTSEIAVLVSKQIEYYALTFDDCTHS